MAPKVGPRGTTIQDVMNLAQNGAQPVESNYVYAPPSTQPPATTAIDYAALLAGQPAPTYGQKYGGMPTAEYFKALNIGAAQQARNVGELARMQAEQANADLEQELEQKAITQLATNLDYAKTMSKQPLLDPSKYTTQGYGPTWFEDTARNKQDAYGAYMDRLNMYDLPSAQRQLTDTGFMIPGDTTLGANRNTVAEQLAPQFTRDKNTQVQPYQDLADNILKIPLSQLAQQMAVQRYGYDPALAQGLFDQSVDIQALQDEQTLFGLMNPDLSYTPEERIRQLYGQEGLDLYNQQQAQSSLYGTPTEQTALEQQEFAELDTNLFMAYASTPAEVYAENPNLARSYMTESAFLTEYQAGVTQIAGAGQGLQETAANEFLLNYYNEVSDPVRSQIMESLINNAVSFMGG